MDSNPVNGQNVTQAVPFLMVTDMTKSLAFYVDGLGFEMKLKWEPGGKVEWCWLQLDAASLMLQEYRINKPEEKLGIGVTIVFMCNDALKIHTEIISRGLSPDEPFVGNNLWVVGIKDPDGYNVLFESPTNVPEGTIHSDWIKTESGK